MATAPVALNTPGGITYGAAKTSIARVVDNGVCDTDPRVLERINEATKLLLDGDVIPVGTMATYDIVADGTTLLLPKELKNAIEAEVRGEGLVNAQADTRQGWYDLVNNFTYVDPSVQHDCPLVDLFLVADTSDPSILRRKYDFPGLTQGATVRVTGQKAFVPIIADTDYLIIQNIYALKMAVQSLECMDRNDVDTGEKYFKVAMENIGREVKRYQLDPMNHLKRRGAYEKDLASYPVGSFAWTRARVALEVPNILHRGKSEITRLVEMAEMRLMSGQGLFKGMLEQFSAEVVGGLVRFPIRVQSILAADVDGGPIDVRSMFFEFQKNGPGSLADRANQCSAILLDRGEVYDAATATTRREYKLTSCTTVTQCLSVVAMLRWVKKELDQQMVIKNFEAIRFMVTGILDEYNEKWKETQAAQGMAVAELEKELRGYLGGQQMTVHVDMGLDYPLGGELL